jgi:hypothetical protein
MVLNLLFTYWSHILIFYIIVNILFFNNMIFSNNIIYNLVVGVKYFI